MSKNNDVLFLFDVDGTLSDSRQKAPEEIIDMLKKLRKNVKIGFVGGSDLEKQKEQLGDNLLDIFDYGFPENGVQFYMEGKLVFSNSIIKEIGESRYKQLVNKILMILGVTECPVKRGCFIELRMSMLNVSPVGRSCSQEERIEFFEYDRKHKVRERICKEINQEFNELSCVIGGQISIDIFPKGWDKTYCLNHVTEKTIVFFGDMTSPGGNDYEIFSHPKVIGNTVKGYKETLKKVNEELEKLNIGKID